MFNNWINPASGAWEDPGNWSLAARPASDQNIQIANNGYKAVAISSATVSGFPSSLTVNNLTISAPVNALSVLLLNYAGTSVPLHILNACTIGTNGSVFNYASALQVDGANSGRLVFTQGGQLVQSGGLTVITPTIELQDGSVNATNATMNLGALNMGYNLNGTSGNFYQSGGTVLCAGIRIDSGTYTLDGGTLYALDKTILYSVPAHFDQLGGTNYGDVRMSGGYYHFYDGLIHGNDFNFTGYGSFFQHGGRAEFATMEIYGGQGGPNYTIEAGTLRSGSLDITGLFREYGGTLVLSNGLFMPQGIFDLLGGTVVMPSMVISNGIFNHYGGTNLVAGDANLYNTGLLLEGGRFSSANLGIGVGASIGQYAGSNAVAGVLSITGNYYLGGGTLSVNGMYLRGTLSIVALGGTPPPFFINSGLINFGGTLNISSAQDSMGQLGLSTNGTVNLGAASLNVRFADSSMLNWDSNSRLVISGWVGSDHVYFGSNASGLSASQLSQVLFFNPAGSSGYYKAQILSTGEVVPIAMTLQTVRSGSQLVLTWNGGYQLLGATNVLGPYQAIASATSPYTNDMRTAPQRFFMLQSP